MIFLTAALLTAPVAAPSPPQTAGACKWVHGRFNVWNGSSVRRIWIIGTHRLIALKDDDDQVPKEVHNYVYSGSYPWKVDGLFGDFHVCALEPSQPGHMQHVKLTAAKHLIFRGKPFQ